MTSKKAGSKISFGLQPYQSMATRYDTTMTWDHSIELINLQPETRYYYSVQTMDSVLAVGDQFYFETLPISGTVDNYSFLVLGDAGTGSYQQREVSLALQNKYGVHHDGLILLGDNAYGSGTQEEYQYRFFDGFYDEIIQNTVIWPAPGNHDYYGASIPMTTTAPYFSIFDLPSQGESGGVPSSTEQYYAYDIGNVHFLSLDSYAVDRGDTSDMANWIRADLAANQLPWIIAYWHHPPYSKGSHDSDNYSGWEPELPQMRENILPILEQYNVDLVLSGHSHSYERSRLISKHYGPSTTFSPEHIRSKSSGNHPLSCPYMKYSDSLGSPFQGTVYSVVGVSGKISGVQPDWPHPVMFSYTNQEYGGMHIAVEDHVLTAEFLTNQGDVYDRFVIFKDLMYEDAGAECDPNYEYEWLVYPNPGVNEITLQRSGYWPQPEDRFTIIDSQGRVVLQQKLEEVNTINISQEGAGVYFFIVEENQQIRNIKFIKM